MGEFENDSSLDGIAVIEMARRFPDADSVEDFWEKGITEKFGAMLFAVGSRKQDKLFTIDDM